MELKQYYIVYSCDGEIKTVTSYRLEPLNTVERIEELRKEIEKRYFYKPAAKIIIIGITELKG